MAKKGNWSHLKDRTYTETAQGRDVYNEQQLERGKLQEKQTMTGRNIFAIILAILAGFLFYVAWAVIAPAVDNNNANTVTEGSQTAGDTQNADGTSSESGETGQNGDGSGTDGTGGTSDTSGSTVTTYDDPWAFLYGSDTGKHTTTTEGSEGSQSQYTRTENVDENGVVVSATTTDAEGHVVKVETLDEYGSIKAIEYYNRIGALTKLENYDVNSKQITDAIIYGSGDVVLAKKTYANGVVQKVEYFEENPKLDSEGNPQSYRFDNYKDGVIYSTVHATEKPTVDYYTNDVVSSTKYYNELNQLTNEAHYDAAGNIVQIDIYNIEKDKMTHTEYYDVDGNLVETVEHHGLLYPKSGSQIFWSIVVALGLYAALYQIFKRNLEAQNMLANTDDINQYSNDQHIALPEEIQRKYDWFPDVGAHSSVLVSSMISHMSLKNKGVNTIQMAKRYKKDVIDTDGEIVYHKGEIMYDNEGNAITEEVPMFDTEFSEALFEASGAPKEVRYSYDPRVIPYNPDNANRDKLQGKEDSTKFFDKLVAKITKKPLKKVSKYDYVTDLINKDWEFPEYEPQRPAGAYIVDTAPVNTMVLAITRAGKGQTVIEPTIDMWTREKRGNNMVINDPKGELLVKFYTRGAYRGFQIVQFNLINAMKTDIYNPLGMAAQSAREGDFTKCAMYVENIAEVFFPVDGGDDPVWPNAANNAFKRAAYGLIDYYLEEERKYRNECNAAIAKGKYIDPQVIETNIDNMWGKVTLYNCYQMFTQLTSKKIPNPAKEFATKMKSGGFEGVPEEEVAAEAEKANMMSDLWNGAPEADCLTLYFSATEKLPNNSMRTLVSNVNNALKAMAGAEKMMASVYGIAITAMSFFTDPTISTLTSGTPSQTVDLAGYSFPRRFGVRFHPDYITKNHYIGLQCKWDAYEDKEFKKPLGKLFEHSDIVSREGWARYFFDGKFEKDVAYVRLRLMNASTGVLVHTYYFEFHKGYQTSLDGRTYTKDPILGTKIAKNGTIFELMPGKDGKFVAGSTTFTRKHLEPIDDNNKNVNYKLVDETVAAITQSYVRYAEKPKMTFLVTPPHLMKYAKLILILIKQLVDLNFDQSYMTKESQKPLYKTRFMLDELGNLQSEGHGISGFETMLSIGLGQEQQFTLILQTLQQLKDVYGVMILSTNRVAAYL